MNGKQKLLYGGKQLQDNSQNGKLQCTVLNIDKFVHAVCGRVWIFLGITQKSWQKYFLALALTWCRRHSYKCRTIENKRPKQCRKQR